MATSTRTIVPMGSVTSSIHTDHVRLHVNSSGNTRFFSSKRPPRLPRRVQYQASTQRVEGAIRA